MRPSASGILTGSRLGALLAFLALGSVLPSTARAECSAHYVTFRSPAGSAAHLELLGRAGALATPDGEAPPARPRPCSGALCSGNPAPVPAPEPLVPASVGGQWALVTPRITPAGPRSVLSPRRDGDLRPVEHSCAIFHPPRTRALFPIS